MGLERNPCLGLLGNPCKDFVCTPCKGFFRSASWVCLREVMPLDGEPLGGCGIKLIHRRADPLEAEGHRGIDSMLNEPW